MARSGEPTGANDLWRLSAVELDRGFRARAFLPSEVLESVLARAAAVNAAVNALVHVDAAGARTAARAADARARRGERLGALDGVPFHLKDNLFWEGRPATWGSRLYADHVAPADDRPVRALRRAGAIPFAKTNTPEFAMAQVTDNALFGPTRNPRDPARTPGGSSGGAAAAVALGLGAFGLATDAGGSIRRPAGYCGVAGLRTALGSVPRRHGFPATAFDLQTIGPIARTAADVALVFAVIAGAGGPTSAPTGPERPTLALVLDGEGIVLESEVRAAAVAMADTLSKLGWRIETIAPPWSKAAVDDAFATLTAAAMTRLRGAHARERWDAEAGAAAQALAERGETLGVVDVVACLDEVQAVRAASLDWFDRHALWLMPTSPCRAWEVTAPSPATIADVPVDARAASVYTTVANLAGLFGLALPAPVAADALPVGMQLVGPAGREALAFDVARALHDAGAVASGEPVRAIAADAP